MQQFSIDIAIKILIIESQKGINKKGWVTEMKNKTIVKQIIDFHKATFDNTFSSLAILQEQTEKMLQTFMLQATWLPAEGKEAIKEWVNIYNKGRIDFKTAADKNYEKVEEYFAAPEVVSKTKRTKNK